MNEINTALIYIGDLSESEKKVLRFIMKDPNVVIQYTIQQVAMMAGTSVSAVQRFTKAVGYSGYRDFRAAIVDGQVIFCHLDYLIRSPIKWNIER